MSNDILHMIWAWKLSLNIWGESVDPGEFIQVNAMARVDLEAEIELSKINLMYCRENFDKILDCPS